MTAPLSAPALDLRTPEGRLRGLDALTRGIPIINDTLGLEVPSPQLLRWDPAVLADPALADPDVYYTALLGAVFDRPVTEESWRGELWRGGALLQGRHGLGVAASAATALASFDDHALVAHADRSRALVAVRVPADIDDQDLIYAKINHGMWENIAYSAMTGAGLDYVRPFGVPTEELDSGLAPLLTVMLSRLHAHHLARGAPVGTLSADRAWFGVSYTNGEQVAALDMEPPLHPVTRGAIIGLDVACSALVPGTPPRWSLADGSLMKTLFWEHGLDPFMRRLAEATDLMVTIGPPHLEGTAVDGWTGPTRWLPVPGSRVDWLWMTVLPVLVGIIEQQLAIARRVTVLAQASVLAGVLGPVLTMHRATEKDGTTLRYLDLGQVMDVAAPDDPRAGTWVRRTRSMPPSILRRPPLSDAPVPR